MKFRNSVLALLLGLFLAGGQVFAGQTNIGGLTVDSNSDPSTTSSTKVFIINNTSGSEVVSVTAGGVVALAGVISSSANITTTGNIQGAWTIGTQYVQIPYFSKSQRPASGSASGYASGTAITLFGIDAADCSSTPGANTHFHICVSDGTNWRSATGIQ